MTYAFDEWELDPGVFELRFRGEARKIEPQAFDLLHCLIRHRDRVVSRDEIIEEVWDGRIVSEATISTAVKTARQVLGDDGRQQRFIRTVHGRGFRFVGEVTGETEAETAEADPAPAAAAPQPAPGAAPAREKSSRPVIAVMPLDDMGGERDDYFAKGLTEDIITNLSRFREILVISRTSTFQFSGSGKTLQEFSQELGADYVVEGSVRRAGERIRVTAQLIDAESGMHQWADSFDRNMEDIFAVQDEVTRTIAAALGVKVQDVARQRAEKKNAAELDAWDCVLRARRFTADLDAASHSEARDLLERAIELDPGSADAHALLSNIYLAEHRFDLNPQPEPIERALEMAEKAVALDPQNAYARCWLAVAHFFRLDNEQFLTHGERALELNPNDPETLADMGHFLSFMGETGRGRELSLRARELNPLHPGWYHFSTYRYHYSRGEFEEALGEVRRVGMPGFYWARVFEAAALSALGRKEEARAQMDRAYELKPDLNVEEELKKWNAPPDHLESFQKALSDFFR